MNLHFISRFLVGFLNACLLSLALVFLLVATNVALTRGMAALA